MHRWWSRLHQQPGSWLLVVVIFTAIFGVLVSWPWLMRMSYALPDSPTCGVDLPLAFTAQCIRPVEASASMSVALAIFGLLVTIVLPGRWPSGVRQLGLMTCALFVVLAFAIEYPVALVAAPGVQFGSRCGGPSVWIHEQSLCASPDVLTALVVGGVLAISAALMMLGHSRRWLPEIVLTAFVLLGIGGVWLRDVRSQPGFTTEHRLQLRLSTKDLANGAALVRPNEFVRLVLVGQGGQADENFINLQVLGLYAGDHSVAYTGELPDSILLAVPQDQLGGILAALQDQRRLAYLQGQPGLESPPPPAPTSPPQTVTIPLPASKIHEYEQEVLMHDSKVVLVIVVDLPDPAGKTVQHEAHTFDAVVSSCTDRFTFVKLERGSQDAAVKALALDLAAAREIYFLQPPASTGTATAVPGTPSVVAPTATPTPEVTLTPTPTSTPCAPNLTTTPTPGPASAQ